jgi:hypothetical protein
MDAHELIDLRPELESLLRQRGPVQFMRDLAVESGGAKIVPHDSQPLDNGALSTRFRFCDVAGTEAFVVVTRKPGPSGQPEYSLDCLPRARS